MLYINECSEMVENYFAFLRLEQVGRFTSS